MYTKEQLIGLEFTQGLKHYIISSSDDFDGLKFHKPEDPTSFYENYDVARVNSMINRNHITLITTPNNDINYEIY